MKFKFIFYLAAALLGAIAVSSCKSGKDEPTRNFKATRMDLSGATALSIISSGESRDNMSFQETGLFKIDNQGNISTVAVYLVTDEDGNSSTKEVPAHIDPYRMVTIGEDYLAFIGCSYVSYDDNTQVDMPYLYRHIMVRKADGRIFAFGDNDLLDSLLGWSDTIQKVLMKVNADEYLIYGGPEMALACLKFDGNGLTVQEMSTNGIVGFPTTYINGNIYSVESPGLNKAGVRFPNGGYDIFEDDYFGEPTVSCYLVLNDGLGAIRAPKAEDFWQKKHTITFNNLTISNSGSAALTTVATMENASRIYSVADGSYDNGKKIILQHTAATFQQIDPLEKVCYSVIDKASGTWESYEPEFADAEGFELSASNFYKGRVWGVKEVKGKLQPTALWINPSTLESGTVDLDFDVNGVDISRSEKDYGNGHLIIYGTRRFDNANVVIDADITTGKCTTLFSHKTYEISTLVPLN